MDSYMTGKRYMTRRTAPHRRHVRNPQKGGLGRLLAFQMIISIILLLIIVIAKSIDLSAADYITGQVKYALTHNVELKSIYTYAETATSNIRDSITAGSKEYKRALIIKTPDDVVETADSEDAEHTADTDPVYVEAITAEPQLSAAPYETSVLAASSGDIDAYIPKLKNVSRMQNPISGMLATPFGEITGPAGTVRMHKGVDISVETMSEVKAVLDGIVTDSGSAPEYGNYVCITHDNELATIYGNCSSVNVKKNDQVKKGDIIAVVGGDSMTGGRHLHFEVWYADDPVDPLEYITVTAG